MHKWANIIIGFAALAGAAGVMESAANAHSVANPLLKTSADILIVNAAAVIGISGYALARVQRSALAGAAVLLAGTLLFCGELSSHVFLGRRLLVLAAPIGGTFMIAGWLIVAVGAFVGLARSASRG